MTHAVVLDTCVLFPLYLRGTLLRLAISGIYRPVWSPDILRELREALLREEASAVEQVDRTIGLMRTHFPDSEVSGYKDIIDSLACDKDDRHVLAAAIRSGATYLITSNVRDFPEDSVAP